MEKGDQNNDIEKGRETTKGLWRQDPFKNKSYPVEEKEPQKRSDDEDKESSQRFQDSNKGGILGDFKDKGESSSMVQIGVPRPEDKDHGVEDSQSKLPLELQNHIQEMGMVIDVCLGGANLKLMVTHEESHLPVPILTEEEEKTFSEEEKEVEVVGFSLERIHITITKWKTSRKRWTNVVQRIALREGGEGASRRRRREQK